MPVADTLSEFYRAVVEAGQYPSIGNLRFHLASLFDGVPLSDHRLLDVGGGDGVHSFYAACRGAREVICLEPEADGSTAGTFERFRKLQDRLGLDQVHLEPVTLQAFSPGVSFDVVLLHDSINHLDDRACAGLPRDTRAHASYLELFSKLASMCVPCATLIVCDCARRNFFGDLGVRDPFAPTIRWAAHQSPETWESLLNEAGFRRTRLRWSSPNGLGAWGRAILGHRLPAYFLKSHFGMWLRRADQE